MYHFVEGSEVYCDCGRYVKATVEGFGPQTHITYRDNDGGETCE